MESTLWNLSKERFGTASAKVEDESDGGRSAQIEILSQSSVRIIKSMIKGVAKRESSQVLCITIVF